MRFLKRCREKLAVQLGISIFIVNLLVLSFCFIFQYMRIEDILLKDDEADIVERFLQSEYNIKSFCEQVDTVSRRLSMDYNLWQLSNRETIEAADRLFYETQAIASMETMQYNYSYLQNISYYGEDGLILKSLKGDVNGNYRIEDYEKMDWYYSSELYDMMRESRQKMKWVGAYSGYDLGSDMTENGKNKYYISAVRNIIAGSGTLVISVDMEYFLDIFYANHAERTEDIYIVDENNIIVAARDRQLLGTLRWFQETGETGEGICKYIEESES